MPTANAAKRAGNNGSPSKPFAIVNDGTVRLITYAISVDTRQVLRPSTA